jgi:predicted Zn-dependent peptidase
MITYETHTLKNGLKVIVHEDFSTPLANFSLLYGVGSRDENPERTGMAHLFEHLMFGGSRNVPAFDVAIQMAGGESNAFTSNDITNFYITLPVNHLETAFWVESDRMANPLLSPEKLEIQRKVVIEEFKQRYLNQPYGDANLHLMPLAYKQHPYRWPTIGADISHIERVTFTETQEFFTRFYHPANAHLCIAGPVKADKMFLMAEKWFGDIPSPKIEKPIRPAEPEQKQARFLTIEANVPSDALYIAYHMGSRLSPDYYAADLLSDILSTGNSSRLHRRLTLENQLFTDIQAAITGSADPGLFLVTGRLNPGVDIYDAEKAVYKELEQFVHPREAQTELQKVQNKAVANMVYARMSTLNKALSLCHASFLGDLGLVEREEDLYLRVTANDIVSVAKKIFRTENKSVMHYKSIK